VEDLRHEIGHVAEEVAYTAVGFAVLGFQRAQVVRRKIERLGPVASLSDQLRGVIASLVGDDLHGDEANRDEAD
jgi:hypothetical protein